MTSSLPRSSPPPGLPRDLVARARIQTESEELGGVADERTQAMLAFELGALYEHGLLDAERGIEHYRRALEHRPAYRPALFALARLYADADRPLDAASVWDRLARASRVPAESAAALCESGILLYDRLGDPERAVALWQEALVVDPSCLCGALLLEHHHRAMSIVAKARHAVEAHAHGLTDPELEAALLVELAAADERAGEADVALARLAHAGELHPEARAVWYETERIARRHAQHEPLIAALRALAEREPASLARSAALLCEAGRLEAVQQGDARRALPLYDRALQLVPGDALALWERSLLHEALTERAAAIADVRALLASVGAAPDGALAAALRVRLGALLQAEGDLDGAIVELHAAAAAAPDSAAATAGLEDALLRAGRHHALRDHLLARAERSVETARAEHLLRAGRIALLQLEQPARALEIMEQAVLASAGSQSALRALYAAAVFAGDSRAAIAAADRLCRTSVDAAERSLLRFDQYHRTLHAGEGPDAALPLLSALLRELGADEWCAHAARIHAAGARRHALLAEAHDALAARAQGDARAAAHLCAAARALARAGEPHGAADRARAALRRAPEDPYALSLLESCLIAAGDSREAAVVLRDAARAHAGSQQRELTLLAAGAAAETAGESQAAARSYAEAADLDAGSLAPRWALLRLAERTRDRGLLLSALERLAQRERELAGSGIANLELGEQLGIQRMGQAASVPLRAALGRADTRAAAALELCALPAREIAPALRDDAVAALAEACGDGAKLAILRDGLAERLRTDSYGAHALLGALVSEHDTDPALSVAALAAARNDGERADALLRLAQVGSDASTGAELSLHGLRVALLARGEEAGDDALLRALETAQRAPGSLPAAVALDEVLWAGDDAESRALALSGRLAAASGIAAPEIRAPLLAARARALLAAGRAAEAALAVREALAADPGDLALWELQRASARARADWEGAADAAEHLAQASEGRFRTELLEEAAALLQNELGQNERAERCLRAAFDNDPGTELAFAWLHDLLLERRDLPGVLDLIERRAAAIDDPALQLDLGYERALLLRAGGRRDDAIAALESVLVADPRHAGALGLLAETCAAAERWQGAVAALQRLAEADVPDAQKRLARLGAAEFLERKLNDPTAACAELEALCALAPDEPGDRARLADAHERSGRYRDAVQGFVHAASRLSGPAAAQLERRAAAILRERLAALGEAVEAYERALAADPLDDEACAQLVELDDRAPERERVLSAFALATRRALDREPLRPELLRKLRRVGAWRARPELEWVALTALAALDVLTEAEARDLQAMVQAQPPAAQLDGLALARLAGPLASAPLARPAQLVSEALAEPSAEQPAPSAEGAARSAPAEQRYEAGAQALARHLGIEALRRLDPAGQRDALRAAFALAGTARAPANVAELGKQLGKRLTRVQRKELARALEALADPERAIITYLQALDEAALRAGLLAADDPRPALTRVLAGMRVDLPACATSPLAIDLLRFWLSDDTLELRRELGRKP
jgi:tetratricopeptide (TPR) repeat protein